jgi:ABC-type antimicrobial peptide transport system permease subunit
MTFIIIAFCILSMAWLSCNGTSYKLALAGDKSTIFKIIDTMLTKKKFKDFFNKNVASL